MCYLQGILLDCFNQCTSEIQRANAMKLKLKLINQTLKSTHFLFLFHFEHISHKNNILNLLCIEHNGYKNFKKWYIWCCYYVASCTLFSNHHSNPPLLIILYICLFIFLWEIFIAMKPNYILAFKLRASMISGISRTLTEN